MVMTCVYGDDMCVRMVMTCVRVHGDDVCVQGVWCLCAQGGRPPVLHTEAARFRMENRRALYQALQYIFVR